MGNDIPTKTGRQIMQECQEVPSLSRLEQQYVTLEFAQGLEKQLNRVYVKVGEDVNPQAWFRKSSTESGKEATI